MAVAKQVARDAGADPQLLALKLPPHSVEAEQSLLGALLIDNQAFDRVADIVEALKKQGHEVERAQIRMPQGPLKQVGDYPLEIALHTDVEAKITVSVLGEQ